MLSSQCLLSRQVRYLLQRIKRRRNNWVRERARQAERRAGAWEETQMMRASCCLICHTFFCFWNTNVSLMKGLNLGYLSLLSPTGNLHPAERGKDKIFDFELHVIIDWLSLVFIASPAGEEVPGEGVPVNLHNRKIKIRSYVSLASKRR